MTNKQVTTDEKLLENVARVQSERTRAGLDGLTGGLECVTISTEPDRFNAAVEEMLRYTGLHFKEAFEDGGIKTAVLTQKGSADFLITCRTAGSNPFLQANRGAKSPSLPNTRLETLTFSSSDLTTYVRIQKQRGKKFLTEDIVHTPGFSFIQTPPSTYTGNSLGFIQWHGRRDYKTSSARPLTISFSKPALPHLKNIGRLDHCATRVRAEERDAAILEFMELTGYTFAFAIYVKSLNSITNVARLALGEYAMVFTSGITSFTDREHSGPTELFIHNYGTRVHHMAFETQDIDATFAALKKDGMEFLVDLVGSPEEGLKQTFSRMSPNTLLVNEYIHRYGGFDGFFTKSNVSLLTQATEKQ